ncbi:MAG: OmpA family protein [Polyangiaceae bacterium]|jgi:outer membrane protein OmpA-like peptidoglycan-associated protein|nr:OmpA family protein [Polyangiaceae bacterium]
MSHRTSLANKLGGCALLLVMAHTPRLAAQDTNLDTERLKPAVTHDGFVATEGTDVRPTADPWELGFVLNYGRNPLVVARDDEITRELVGGRLGIDLMASVTLAEPLALGVDLPLYLLQTGDQDPSGAGLGDVRIVPKLRLLDDRESIGLALLAELRLPTHTGDYSGGANNVVFVPRLALDHRWRSGLRFGLNFGATIREKTTFYNVEAGSELLYSGALGYRFGGNDGKVELGADLLGGFGLGHSDESNRPLELFGYLKGNPSPEWEIFGGPGIGVLPGYGVPTYRAFFGVRFTPTSHDRDHDGISDDQDRCPDKPEDRDRFEDYDGCPEDDDDSDGIPDATDECPDEKETINGFEDNDGCPDEGPAKVIVEEGEIRILETIKFEKESSTIDRESYSILDQVALTMKANKQIKRVRVEGHTDDTGTREYNLQLSRERAASVRKYLVNKGVDKGRLSSEGFGPDRPRKKGTGNAARAENRRVEFIVEQ